MKKILFLFTFIPFLASAQIETLPEGSFSPARIWSNDKNMGMGPSGTDLNFRGYSISSTRNMGIGTSFSSSLLGYPSFINDGKLTIRHNSNLENDTGENGPQLILDEYQQNDFARLRFRNSWATSSGTLPFYTYTYNRSPRYWDIAGFANGATSSQDFLNFFNSSGGDILTIRGDGKVGILNSNPTVPLHINSGLTSTSSTTGAMILGLVTGGHLTLDNNEINAYSSTSGTNLVLNEESTGSVYIGGSGAYESDLRVYGYTRLGGASAPNIKMKKISGTTGSTSQTFVAHGLTEGKILDVSVLIDGSNAFTYPPSGNGLHNVSNQYRVYFNDTNIYMSDLGSSMQSRPYRILITYEE